jgi:hypothetical protein
MSVARSVAEVLKDQVTLEVEGIDRMYLNVYVPQLQREQGVASFFRVLQEQRDERYEFTGVLNKQQALFEREEPLAESLT